MRRPAMLRAFLLAAAIAVAGTPGPAIAQDIVPRDVERGVTVQTRPRPDFDPLGLRIGGFRLDAALEAGLGFDSNVFGRTSDIVSDGFGSQLGRASLNSTWSTHGVGVSGSVAARQYFSESSLDFTDWDLGGFGRYDLSADTNVEARYRHYRQHLDVFSFDVQTAGIFRPVPYSSDEGQVSATTQLNRIGLLATAVYRTYRFEDVPALGTRGNVSVNDFDTLIGALGASYALAPGRSVTGVVRLQDIRYIDSATGSDPLRGRDSFTWEALLGFRYDFDGVWQGRIGLGWRQREYTGSQLKALSGPAVEGELTWAPTLLTTVRFAVASSIEESIRQDAVSYRRYIASATVDHELRRNVILTGQVRGERRAYEQPSQSASDLILSLGSTWLINRNLALVGAYSFQDRLEATGGFREFGRHLVVVRLRVAL